jgi:hypothetical protein
METLYYLGKLFVECKTNNEILDAMLEISASFCGSNCCHAKLENPPKKKKKNPKFFDQGFYFQPKKISETTGKFLENSVFP